MKEKIRIGFVGCGQFARHFVPLFKAHPACEYVALCDKFRDRAEKFMEMLLREYSGKRILCVSHGGFIKQTLKVVLGIRTFRSLPACENTAICRYAAKEGNVWQLVSWNDAAHLKSFNRSTGW